MRGHARRRKPRQPDQSPSTLVDDDAMADQAELQVTGDSLLDILDFLRHAEPDPVAVPASYNDPTSIFTSAAAFPTERYVLGLVACPECQNEILYYQDRDVLAAGYRFRCRICQCVVQATLP
jgi:hypothetical protein